MATVINFTVKAKLEITILHPQQLDYEVMTEVQGEPRFIFGNIFVGVATVFLD